MDMTQTVIHPLLNIAGTERRFCGWGGIRASARGKPKAPATAEGELMGWSDPTQWLTFDEAKAAMTLGKVKGIGYFTTNGDHPEMVPITVVDLDHCVENGVIVGDWQRAVVELANTLTVISPSGTGLHLIFVGAENFVAPEIAAVKGDETRGYEVFNKAHHVRLSFTIFRNVPFQAMSRELWEGIAALLPGWLEEVAEAERAAIEAKAKADTPKAAQPDRAANAGTLTDAQIRFVARKFNDSHDIADILTPRGYTVGPAGRDGKRNVTRAGKDPKDGDSGNIKDGKYYPFSANDQLKANKAYTAFGAWAVFEHGDNQQVAARAAADEMGLELGRKATAGDGRKGDRRSCDDIGNGYRFADQHSHEARYVEGWGWMHNDGKRWTRDATGAIMRMAKQTVETIWDEVKTAAEAAKGEGETAERAAKKIKPLTTHAAMSRSLGRLNAMITTAQSELSAKVEDFDRDPFLLNVQNGTLELKTGKLRPHQAKDMLTRVCSAPYDKAAPTPQWTATLDRFLSPTLKPFIQRCFGLACSGQTEKAFFFLHGAMGNNGKSTLTSVVSQVLGDYAMRFSIDVLMSKHRSAGEDDQLANLAGARFVVSNEVDDRQMNAKLIKDLTGEMDSIRTKFMGQNTFQFQPHFKLFIYGNKKPRLDATDQALWNRVKCIPFERVIPEGERIANFAAQLQAEAGGILAWLVDGFTDYLQHGLAPPEEITQATAAYRAEMDSMAQFIAECCVESPDAWAKFADIRDAYKDFTGAKEIKANELSKELKSRGFVPAPGKGNVRIYRGIGLQVANGLTGLTG